MHQVENCTCFELTSLVKRFGKEKRTANVHVTSLYIYTIYIVYIYISSYVFISMFLQIPMDTGCQVFSILLLFFPTCFPHLKVAEFSEEFPKNYYDQAVEGVGASATYVDGLRVSICPTYP